MAATVVAPGASATLTVDDNGRPTGVSAGTGSGIGGAVQTTQFSIGSSAVNLKDVVGNAKAQWEQFKRDAYRSMLPGLP